MKSVYLSVQSTPGRPREINLTPAQGKRLSEIYLATNKTRAEGSMEAAWVLFCEEAGEFLHTVKHHRLVSALPVAALEIMRRAKGLVTPHRGGSKELRLKGPYQQGGMRTHWSENRRLRAGESYSVDDLTRNVAVWIPWPHGGCACSEKYGVRLGRWQTLVVCDDASFAIPAVSSVFRYAASYQGTDAASLIYQTESSVGMAGFESMVSRWVVEGGVWQSNHALAALAGRFHSAKGRPMQKLIERWFGAAQTLDAVWNRDMGRRRGEILENNQLWIDCRAGRKDPREHFAAFEDGQATLLHLINYMNEREVRSDLYGRWVPQERWDNDTASNPLVCRDAASSWVMMPERRKLTVTRLGMIQCRVIMADGVSRTLAWNAPFLYEWMQRSVELYFDPLGQWPLDGVVVQRGTRKVIGIATCQNPFGESRDADRERVAAIRRTMLSDLRIILGGNAGARRTQARGVHGTIEINTFHRSGTDQPADREKNQGNQDAPEVLDPRHTTVAVESTFGIAASREGSVLMSRTTRGDADPTSAAGRLATPSHVSASGGERGVMPAPAGGPPAERLRSLGRRAAAARDQVPNW
jgi:hypothetical protein